jgi:predicted ATPase
LPQHKRLRAVVDWSWELLTNAERTVLRRLSVFSGGVSLEAAERVCAGDAVQPEQVLELLTALTQKSLLATEGGGALRYRMLGTIEEYARSRLAEAGEADLARHTHLAYFTELAETADPHLHQTEQLEWLARLGSSTTTSDPPYAARSLRVRRTRRCGSRPPPAGTGSSAGTRPKASS